MHYILSIALSWTIFSTIFSSIEIKEAQIKGADSGIRFIILNLHLECQMSSSKQTLLGTLAKGELQRTNKIFFDNENIPKNIPVKLSTRRFGHFQTRFGLKLKWFHGEACKAGITAVNACIQLERNIISKFVAGEIWIV